MVDVPVANKVLKWARKYRGLEVDAAAAKLGLTIEQLEALERGDKLPSVTLFKKIARSYRIPEATLARRTPPGHLLPPPTDCRTFEGQPPKLGFDVLVAISDVRGYQQNVAEVAEADQQPLLDVPTHSLDDDPWELGERVRRRLGVPKLQAALW